MVNASWTGNERGDGTYVHVRHMYMNIIALAGLRKPRGCEEQILRVSNPGFWFGDVSGCRVASMGEYSNSKNVNC